MKKRRLAGIFSFSTLGVLFTFFFSSYLIIFIPFLPLLQALHAKANGAGGIAGFDIFDIDFLFILLLGLRSRSGAFVVGTLLQHGLEQTMG